MHTYRNPADISRLLSDRTGDSGRVFLVPSNRDRSLLLDMLAAEGASPPEGLFGSRVRERNVWIWDDLYRALLETGTEEKPRAQIDPPDHWLLLRSIISSLRERFAESLPPGVFSEGFLDLAGGAVRELLREDVPPETLAGSLGCAGCPQDGGCIRLDDESGILCRIYRDYTALLEERNLADSAQIPSLGRDLLAESETARERAKAFRITAVGFLSFASGQLRFLRQLLEAGAEMEFFVPGCGPGDFYTATDQFPEASVTPVEGSGPALSFSMAGGDLRLASDTLARELLLWSAGEGKIAESTGLPFPGWSAIGVCGDGEDTASAAESFTRYGLPFSLKDGVLVSETILWKSALRALDLASEGWPAGETADFLSGLLFSPFGFPREDFAASLPCGRKGWLGFLGEAAKKTLSRNAPLHAFRRALAFTDAVTAGGRPEELLSALGKLAPDREEMKGLIAGAREFPSLDGMLRTVNVAVLEAGEKERALRDLARDLGDSGRAVLRGGEAAAFLARWAETASTRTSPPVSPAMAVYQGTPPVLTSAAVWVFLGATASRWPGQVRESPLLNDDRKGILHDSLGLGRSHLPLVPEKRKQREALFRRLAACARELCLFVRPLADGGGRPLPPSPFVTEAEAGPSPWLIPAETSYERSLGDLLPPAAGETACVRGVEIPAECSPRKGLSRRDPRFLSLPLPEKVFHLSGLDDYAACPFLYYCRRMGLEPAGEELFRRDLAGNGFHRLWELAWKERLSSGGSLEELADRFFDAAYGECYPGLLSDQRLFRHRTDQREKNRRLGALQDALETSGLGEARREQRREFPLPELEIGGTVFRGRCDRMDILGDGSALLFDYKSGRATKYTKSLQLAAYSIALREGPERRSASAAVFLGLSDGSAAGAGHDGAPLWLDTGKTSLADLESQAADAMNRAAKSLASGDFPPEYDSDRCRYCSFSSLCRRRDFRAEEEDNGEGEE
jgi:RecB family exonuclease